MMWELWAKLTPAQQEHRSVARQRVLDFMERAAAGGGMVPDNMTHAFCDNMPCGSKDPAFHVQVLLDAHLSMALPHDE